MQLQAMLGDWHKKLPFYDESPFLFLGKDFPSLQENDLTHLRPKSTRSLWPYLI